MVKPSLLGLHHVQLAIPARKAHPGILVEGIDALAQQLERSGVAVSWDEGFPGHRRFYAPDPFGNRLEFLEPSDG